MEFLISIGAKIVEYTVAPIGHQLGYLCFYKRNVDELKVQINQLGDAKERLQRTVDVATTNGEKIEAVAEKLLTHVGQLIEDNEKFIQDAEQANTKCSIGAFPMRYRLSRRAKKLAEDVVTQINEIKYYDGKKISYCPHLPISVENKGYKQFESRNRTLAEIMKAVKDPNVRVLGVWGMGGVGKTMLAKEVARLAKDEEKYEVVFTTISTNPNFEKIKEDIRKGLGIKELNNIEERIRNRLREENKILVIVDDVWEKSFAMHDVIEELEKVGICFGVDKKGCKILVTSRDHCVLNNAMNVDEAWIFQVGVLSEDEAMSLFSKIVGDKANEPHLSDLATKIVRKCGGLPIAVTAVASALKNKSRSEVWKNALHELTKSDPSDDEGINQKVYNCIRLSYDMIQSGQAKKLFLLCSLFEEDEEIPVNLLCNYAIGLNMFGGTNKLEDARNKTVTLVEKLKDYSLLLLDSEEGDFVKLHDVIREVVISIASKGDEPMYNIGNDVDELDEYLVKSTAISVCEIKANQYPKALKSPKLKLLRLICERPIPDNEFQPHFFVRLDKLLVLDLKKVYLKPSPSPSPSPASSFCLLQNLQTLRLTRCTLEDITWIGELKNLKILDLSYSSITELPKEIGNLDRLLSLCLQNCDNLQAIRPNIVSRLTRLEELNLASRSVNWKDGDDERPYAYLEEVKDLRDLTNLSLNVPDVKILSKNILNMFSDKLDKFNIQIGGGFDSLFLAGKSSRMLKLKLRSDSELNEHDFEVLLKRSVFLHLIGLKSAKSIAYELDSGGFPQLKELVIENSTELLCIVSSNGNMDSHAAFGKLINIGVRGCHKMKSLFPMCNIPKQLERIRVEDCEMVEEIITDGREGNPLEIPELHELKLSNLPKLVQFKTTSNSDEIGDGAQSIDDSVVPLFNGEVAFSKLEELDLQELNVGKIWNGDKLRSLEFGFQSLTKLTMMNCHGLKGLIPSSAARSLVHLKDLCVRGCVAMEEVVFIEESTPETTSTFENIIIFPKLEELELSELPNLKRFYAGNYVDCSSLLRLFIIDCPKLGEIFLTDFMPMIKDKNIEDLSDQVDKPPLLIHKDPVKTDQLITTESAFCSKITCEPRQLGGAVEEHHHDMVFKIKRLERVRLGGLPNLEHPYKVLQYVDELLITECDGLKVLAPPLLSLRTLTILRITSCKGLTSNLFHRSTAKSLLQLRGLIIYGCPNLRQVIANDYNKEAHDDDLDEIGDGIIFSQLETLCLKDLSSLEIFYSGDSVLKFPRLKNLAVDGCLCMKTFSHGNIDCPMLDKILRINAQSDHASRLYSYISYHLLEYMFKQSDLRKTSWEGDIKTTIQKLWKDENDSSFRRVALISEENTEDEELLIRPRFTHFRTDCLMCCWSSFSKEDLQKRVVWTSTFWKKVRENLF